MRLLALLAALLLFAPGAAAQQRTFRSPEDAVKALVAAARAGDANTLRAILGNVTKSEIATGDPKVDREVRERFVAAYAEANKLERPDDSRAVLVVGKDDWPFPFPLVRKGDAWRFDTVAGREEIVNRRIGRNELSAIQAIQAYVDAQREYYLRNPQNDKLLQYAQRIVSSEKKRDGLYYPTKDGEPPSPLGRLYRGPYHGYHFRILKSQGSAAPGGAYDYVAQRRMIGGFALVAYPASYGSTGVMSFLVNHAGVVYEKDLGPDTAKIAEKMARFNPDAGWTALK